MNHYNQQGQALPYPTNQLMNTMMQLTPGQLHFQLQLNVHQNLYPYLPLIGTVAIEMIQNKAQQNPLRVFLFNQMSVNQYNNPDFIALVGAISEFVEMVMMRNSQQNIQNVIYGCADKMTEIFCAGNLNRYPPLRQMLMPQIVEASYEVIQFGQRLSQEIGQYKQSLNQQTSGFPQMPGSISYGQPQMNQQRGGWGNQPQQNGFGVPSSGNSSMFSTNQPQPSGPNVNNSVYLTKPRTEASPAPVTPQAVWAQANVNSHASNIREAAPVLQENKFYKSSEIEWVPSVKYPFNIAYDSSKNELLYCIEADGSMRPFVQPLSQEKIMEREKHYRSSVVPGSFIASSPESSQERAQALLNGLRDGSGVSSLEIERRKIVAMAKDNPSMSGEIDVLSQADLHITAIDDKEIWKDCDIRLLSRKQIDKRVSAYSTCAHVIDPLVSTVDPKPLADKLSTNSSFLNACHVLKDAKAALGMDKDNGQLQIINYFNGKLTKRVNDFVQKQLALNITINCFMSDVMDLIELIEAKFTDKFSKHLRRNQERIILDCVQYVNDELLVDLEELYNSEDIDGKPFVTYFYQQDYFMALNLFSSDLNVDVPKTEYSTALFADQTPLMKSIAQYIFEQEKIMGYPFRRHLIRTLDRVVIEINRSVIDAETLLISL